MQRWQVDQKTYVQFFGNFEAAKHIPGTELISNEHKNAKEIKDWSPATIVMQYDGAYNGKDSGINLQEHREIMTNIFSTPSVRCVLSTKLTENLFDEYFCNCQSVRPSEWRVISFSFSFVPLLVFFCFFCYMFIVGMLFQQYTPSHS